MSGDDGGSFQDLSMRVAKVLRIGAIISSACLIIGVVLLMLRPSSEIAATLMLSDLPSAIAKWEPSGLITLGILAMILTPIARVMILVQGFAARKDRAFILIGFIVLAILLASIAIAY